MNQTKIREESNQIFRGQLAIKNQALAYFLF